MHDYPTNEMIAANEAGYEAAMDNRSRYDNPHAEDSDEFRSWEAGWLQARSDLRDQRVSFPADGYHAA